VQAGLTGRSEPDTSATSPGTQVLVGDCKVGDLACHLYLLLNLSGPVDEFGVDIEGVWVLGAKDVLIHGQ
jgi:hypothetical protein